MSCKMWSTILWHTQSSAANSRAVHRRSASNREGRSWTVLFSTWGHPVHMLSWTASLPSRNDLTHRVIARRGNAASPHASRSPWKHSCVLWYRATLFLIQERCSSFVNIILKRSHYPYESQRSITAVDSQSISALAALTHLTVIVQIHKTGSFKLTTVQWQQCCHYFLSILCKLPLTV